MVCISVTVTTDLRNRPASAASYRRFLFRELAFDYVSCCK